MPTLEETLDGIESKKVMLENATQRLNDLLREVRRRIADNASMNQPDELTTLLARAKAAYAVRVDAIRMAANDFPDLP